MAKAMNTSVELALTLVRKAHTISLLAGLALALSGMSCESPTRLKLSQQPSVPVAKSTGKHGNGSLELDGTRVQALLNIVFDVNFYDFSHGFREGHSQHMAINELREKCRKLNIGWLISADITGLFNNLDRSYLREMISRRVNDGGILRLIGKWLNAGVMEGDKVIYPDTGVPQVARQRWQRKRDV